jgi:pimeloyl-ACP methyl ester carboxylesterase
VILLRLRRAAIVVVALLATAATIQLLRFALWRHRIVSHLSADSELQQTALGPIEYTRVGDTSGVPVLWLHGTPGGYDQISRTMLASPAMRDGMASIVVSRPGYLRTPLASGATPVEQAHLFAALLDSLHIRRVVVVGVSGGGPSALQFARLYPKRTRALVLAFAFTKRLAPDPVRRRQRLADAIGLGDWFNWRFSRRLDRIPGLDPTDTAMVRRAQVLLASTVPRAARLAGNENDALQFDRPEGWPIDGITTPTLILAGTEDTTVPIAHAGYAKAMIPGSRFVMIEGDHRVSMTRAPDVERAIRTFVVQQRPR